VKPSGGAPLVRVASLCALAEQKAREAALLLETRPLDAEEVLRSAGRDSAEALKELASLGVRPSEAVRPRVGSRSGDLGQLMKLENSRPEALALLDALRAALPLAEALDEKRGDVLDEPVGGSAGLVWGEDLVQLKSKLELELFGPGEAVTGARE
jgi:hypothetical protein